jgi:hypothetical protein
VLHPRGVPENTRHFQTRNVSRTYKNYATQYQSSLIRLVLLSEDIPLNPGPVKYPCGKFCKPIRKNQKGMQCKGTGCEQWHHIKWVYLPVLEYKRLSSTSESWYCKLCTLLNFSDSYFDIDTNEINKTNDSYSPLYIPPLPEVENVNGICYDLIHIRKKYTKNVRICHLNINIMRYKFDEIKELLFDKVVDWIIVSETKIDSTFKDSLF